MKSYLYTGVLATGMLFGAQGSAMAADLGGDCCADLEERVAVLEATTARKGNRKVSLTISGWVHKSILIWDDGIDSDVYAGLDGSYASTRFRFKGNANINADWSAGYLIEIETNGDRLSTVTQTDDDNGAGLNLRKSSMYVKSKQLGKITWGLASPATDDITFYSTFGTVFATQADFVAGFSFNTGLNGASVSDFAGSLNGVLYFEGASRNNIVRYDTPVIAGFVLSASAGEDDFWDVALRMKQKLGDFEVKAAIGYSEFGGGNDISGAERGYTDEAHFAANAGVKHTPTGIFIHYEYSAFDWENSATSPDLDSEGYQVLAGITQKWSSLGSTTLFGSYTQVDDGYVRAEVAEIANGSTTEVNRWQLGLIQNIDAAAMQLYVTYEQNEYELNGVSGREIDIVNIGGVIKF